MNSSKAADRFPLWLGIALLALALAVGGGSLYLSGRMSAASEAVDSVPLSAEEQLTAAESHDLSASGPISLTGQASAGEERYTSDPLLTNRGQITVTNNGGSALEVNLYYTGALDTPIQTLTLEAGSSAEFTNLTHARQYCIGVVPEADTEVNLLISD